MELSEALEGEFNRLVNAAAAGESPQTLAAHAGGARALARELYQLGPGTAPNVVRAAYRRVERWVTTGQQQRRPNPAARELLTGYARRVVAPRVAAQLATRDLTVTLDADIKDPSDNIKARRLQETIKRAEYPRELQALGDASRQGAFDVAASNLEFALLETWGGAGGRGGGMAEQGFAVTDVRALRLQLS